LSSTGSSRADKELEPTTAATAAAAIAKRINEAFIVASSFDPAPGLNVGLYRAFMVIGGVGTVLTAGYFLWMLQRVNMGTIPERWREHGFRDVLAVEWLSWLPLLALTLILGLFPRLIFGMTNDAVGALTSLIGG